MPEHFIWKLLGSFIVGALCVSAFSITADRFDSKASGILASFPATLLASYFFLGLTDSTDAARQEAAVVPALMGFFGIFLCLYCVLARRGFLTALTGSLAVWFLLSALIVQVEWLRITHTAVLCALLVVVCYFFLEKVLMLPSMPGRPITLSLQQAVLRMCSGGSIVAGSVYLGAVSGPAIGAIMAAFPAVTVATLLATYQSGGVPLSTAFAKSLSLSSMVNSSVLSVAVYLLYGQLGIYAATAIAAALVCLSSALLWKAFRLLQ